MKKLFTFCILSILFATKLNAQCPWNFTVTSTSGNFSITCSTTTLNLYTTHSSSTSITYSWTGPTFTSTLANVSVTASGSYSVIATNIATSCSLTQVFVVGVNTVVPTNTVTPVSQVISCNNGIVSFTGTSFNGVQHNWYSPLNPLPSGVPIASVNNSLSVLSGSLAPGFYTLQTTDLANGCKTSKTVTITSLSAWPTFSLNSPTNFTVGCPPSNCTTLSIINPVSTQTPPATCSYTFLAPTFSGVVTPSIILGGNSSTITCVPGNWTVIVQDNSNWCRTSIVVPVIQNTVLPTFSLSGVPPTTSISCNGTVVISPPVYAGYSVSTTSGTLAGNPIYNVTNLCNGQVKVCVTNLSSSCKKCDSLTFAGPTGIGEFDIENNFVIYPNPTSSSLFIKNTSGKNATVKIFNVEGRIIEVLEALESTDSRKVASSPDKLSGSATGNEIEIKNINAGIYLVEMNVEGVVLRKKVVIN